MTKKSHPQIISFVYRDQHHWELVSHQWVRRNGVEQVGRYPPRVWGLFVKLYCCKNHFSYPDFIVRTVVA